VGRASLCSHSASALTTGKSLTISLFVPNSVGFVEKYVRFSANFSRKITLKRTNMKITLTQKFERYYFIKNKAVLSRIITR